MESALEVPGMKLELVIIFSYILKFVLDKKYFSLLVRIYSLKIFSTIKFLPKLSMGERKTYFFLIGSINNYIFQVWGMRKI